MDFYLHITYSKITAWERDLGKFRNLINPPVEQVESKWLSWLSIPRHTSAWDPYWRILLFIRWASEAATPPMEDPNSNLEEREGYSGCQFHFSWRDIQIPSVTVKPVRCLWLLLKRGRFLQGNQPTAGELADYSWQVRSSGKFKVWLGQHSIVWPLLVHVVTISPVEGHERKGCSCFDNG